MEGGKWGGIVVLTPNTIQITVYVSGCLRCSSLDDKEPTERKWVMAGELKSAWPSVSKDYEFVKTSNNNKFHTQAPDRAPAKLPFSQFTRDILHVWELGRNGIQCNVKYYYY